MAERWTLSMRNYGIVKLATGAMFFLAPALWQFGDIGTSSSYVAGSLTIVIAVLTADPLGIGKLAETPTHWVPDLVLATLFAVAPWLLRFSDSAAARNFFIVMALLSVGVTLATRLDRLRVTHTGARQA